MINLQLATAEYDFMTTSIRHTMISLAEEGKYNSSDYLFALGLLSKLEQQYKDEIGRG